MLRRLSVRTNHWRSRIASSSAGRTSVLNGLSVCRSLTTESFFSFAPAKQWGAINLDENLTKELLAKYFAREDGKTESIATALSPDVIGSMVAEVTRAGSKIDYKTVDMLVEQAMHLGSSSTGVLETLIKYYIDSNNVVAAANLLNKCDPATFAIKEKLCINLMNGLVENCNWDHAFKTAIYMLYLDYDLPNNAIFFTVGGLNSTTAGVIKVLELVKVITLKKRTDLAQAFSFNKVSTATAKASGVAGLARCPVSCAYAQIVKTICVPYGPGQT